jgi:hypothetical protein
METTVKKKPSVKKVSSTTIDGGTFLVKTKGYKEQFSSLDAAKRAYGRLRKKKAEDGEKFKIELLKKEKNGSFEVIEEIEMTPED